MFIVLCLLVSITQAKANELQKMWDQENNAPFSALRKETVQKARDHHFVFIPGIMNEIANVPLISSYFGSQIHTLKKLDIDTTYFATQSSVAIYDNADTLYREFSDLQEDTNQSLDVEAHSKGGAEVFYTILKYPALIYDKVIEHVILIQPAIGGSLLAGNDHLNLALHLLRIFVDRGLESLEPETARSRFNQAFVQFQEYTESRFGKAAAPLKMNEFASKILYVRGYAHSDDFGRGVRLVLAYCQNQLDSSQLNDGLLYVKDQAFSLPDGSGRVFGKDSLIQADHLDSVVDGTMSPSPNSSREALMRAILQKTYE